MTHGADAVANTLSAVEAAPLVNLVKACRSAARVLALYPAEHPNIAAALAAVATATTQVTSAGPLHLSVLPDSLLVGGHPLARRDQAVTDFADLLHRHLVAQVTIQPDTPADVWQRFLALVSIQPDQARGRGGIVKLWASEAEPAIAVKQLDYRELLRESIKGEPATWEAIIAQCLAGESLALDEWVVDLLLDVLNDPERAGELVAAVEERTSGGTGRGALIVGGLLHAVATFVAQVQPQRLEAVLCGMADAAARLPMGTLAGLMGARRLVDRPELAGFVENLAVRIKDATVAQAIVSEVRNNRGTSPDLAGAVWGIAPDIDRREAILALAREILQKSSAFEDSATDQMWRQAEQLLSTYDHDSYVGDPYTSELQAASRRAVELDQARTDPPERLARWASTVSDDAVRLLDAQLLVDLLGLRTEPGPWRELADLVVSRIQVCIVLGDLQTAAGLTEAIAARADPESGHALQAAASAALEQVLDPAAMRHLASHLDTSDERLASAAERMCRAIGTSAVGPLAQTLAREERTRSRNHLVALLVSYGPAGRQAVERLMQSSNAAVRRTAVVLLREFGGHDALPELESLLNDRAPHVQREATRAIAMLGIEPAFQILANALVRGTNETRGIVVNVLWSLPLADAVPVLAFVAEQTTPRGGMRDVHEKALQRLGESDSREAIDALGHVLRRGWLFAPFMTASLRRQAAGALARIGSVRAIEQLEAAAANGARGTRSAARSALRERVPAGSRSGVQA
ncbi:MAG: HEAT repeat domain-containing protein [Acidobacteriota bacterium]